MKTIIFILTILSSTLSFAAFDKGVLEATLRANKKFSIEKLDQVGSAVRNSKTDDVVRNHCVKRRMYGYCEEMIHILETEGKHLVLHDRKGMPITQNVARLQDRINDNLMASLRDFTDLDPSYNRQAGDFTGYVGMVCIWEPATCAILLLLPVAIAADLVMLPLDLGMRYGQRISTRKRAKFFVETLKSDEEILLNSKSFNSFLKGLSQF